MRWIAASIRPLLTFLLILYGWAGYASSFFVENKGQWNDDVKFRIQYPGMIIYLLDDGYSVLQYDDEAWAGIMHHHHEEESKGITAFFGRNDEQVVRMHHYKVKFDKALIPVIEGAEKQPYELNFFLGDASAQRCGDFRKVIYKDIYPGIDVEFVATPNRFKYNIHVGPGADLAQVKMLYTGLEGLELQGGELILETSLENIRENIPLAYYKEDGMETETGVNFVLEGRSVRFAREDNKALPMVVDPEVVFATYSGSTADNFGFTATYDNEGHLYAGGITTSPDMSFDPNGRYPATTGAFSTTYSGGSGDGNQWEYNFACDITISKYSPDGSTLLFATYLGGSLNEYPHSLVVDNKDQVIVFGTSFSLNYPTKIGAYQPLPNGKSDIIVTKLSADGSSLVGSTYVGGAGQDGLNEKIPLKYFYADNFRGDVNVDAQGNIYAASCTQSDDFPTTSGVLQEKNGGDQDGVIFKMNADLTSMEWCTYLGASRGEALYSLDFDLNGDIFVSGGTMSNDLKGTSGTRGEKYNGGPSDGFIAAVSPDGQKLLRSAYWGTNQYDQILSLDIDKDNKVYVVGQTQGRMPVIGDVYNNKGSGQFITRFTNDLKTVEFSTVFGTGDGFPDITVNAFLVDECKKIFVSGWGGETSMKGFSSTFNLPVTPDAYEKSTDGSDFYLIVLSKNAEELIYATFFGGDRSADHVDGGTSRFDKTGVIYQSVCASCPPLNRRGYNDFPTTPGAYSVNNISPRCSNASFKIAFGNLNRTPRLGTKILTVAAFDTLDFQYSILDLDDDTMFISYDPDQGIAENITGFRYFDTAVGFSGRTYQLIPDCDDLKKDTIRIKVHVKDKGCPEFKDSVGEIKIVVTPPPVLDPPETVCLVFTPDDEVQLSWDAIPESPFYLVTYLVKVHPDGREEFIDSSFSNNSGSYLDKDVNQPRKRNYTYYLRVRNKCGALGPPSIKVSSTKEFESPIAITQVLTATVVENKNILVKWLSSTEEDFGSFDVYRFVSGDKNGMEHVATTTDTFFIDENVDVQTTSYCYSIVVNDNCGHVSKMSNRGCTIVLEGNAIPFAFNLWWNPYHEWDNGVQEYTLFRSVDTGSQRPYALTPATSLNYHDDTLNYDWGGYWYTVEAKELAGYDEVSRSNSIYLIQPPLLHVPNAFTPNGDHLNEKWGIVPVFVKTYHLQVYDRWGEQVYESTEKKVLWDGFYKKEQTANSVYVYTITYTGWDRSVHHVKGTVTVVK